MPESTLLRHVAVVFPEFGPYHVARIDALAKTLGVERWRVTGVRFRRNSATYAWRACEPQIAEKCTLLIEDAGPRRSLSLFSNWCRFLYEKRPTAVLLPSYWPVAHALCLLAAKVAGAKCIMMNESWAGTERTGRFGRRLKRFLVSAFDAALVGGSLHIEHFSNLGIPRERMAIGYDVVDNEFFSEGVSRARAANRPEWLPQRYFLNVGRMVPKKNLDGLVQSYARLISASPGIEHALVLVGDGECRKDIINLARSCRLPVTEVSGSFPERGRVAGGSPGVFVYPFAQVEQLPLYYAFATAFVLPSHTEEWGLVVNEAMASSLPVLVSNKAGCAPDLVRNGRNGFTFSPADVEELARYLADLARDPAKVSAFGAVSRQQISAFGPERFARGCTEMLKICGVDL